MRPFLSSCLALAAATCVLAGCSTGTANFIPTPILPIAGPLAHVSGVVHGGQQPITGATIQLWQVGTTGDGAGAAPMLTQTVQTGPGGAFTIDHLYTCPVGDPLVYITASGGNPGLAGGTNNTAIALMAALHDCNSLSTSTYIVINEVTTVAAAAALAPFTSPPFNIGSSPSDATALAAAFNNAAAFADYSVGTSPGAGQSADPSYYGQSVPASTINTLANVLAACINTTGGTASDTSTACGKLFSLTGSPTDTASAIVALEKNPASYDTGSIFGVATANGPFQPQLATAPTSDFTVAIITPTGGSTAVRVIPSTAYTGSAFWITSTTPDCLYQGTSIVQINGNQYLTGGYVACGRIWGIVPSGLPYGVVSGYVFTSTPGQTYNVYYPYYVNIIPKPDTSIAFSPTTLYWIGTAGVQDYEQEVDVVNHLNSTVTLGTPQITGTNAAAFTIDYGTSTCTSTLTATASCRYNVIFTPSITGLVTASMVLSGNNGAFNITAVLAGTGMN